MSVRVIVFSCLLIAAMGQSSPAQSGSPLSQTSTTKNGLTAENEKLRFADYEQRLNAVLQTRRDEEKKFVADLMLMVRNEQLPEKLIETSYKWVMNKRPGTNYPFVYFEKVIRIQAALVKIELPEFDYSIYEELPSRSRLK